MVKTSLQRRLPLCHGQYTYMELFIFFFERFSFYYICYICAKYFTYVPSHLCFQAGLNNPKMVTLICFDGGEKEL